MDDSGLNSDERVALTTPDVVVKSVSFEATLTNRRIILVDRKDNLIAPKEITLESIRHIEAGENAIRDPILTLFVNPGTGTRQMILTFPQRTGASRKYERDEWVTRLRNSIATTAAENLPRKGVPVFPKERKRIIEHTSYREDSPAPAPTGERRYHEEAPAQIPPETRPAPREVPANDAQLPYGSFCSRCGNRVAPGSLFCSRCGTKIAAPAPEIPREMVREAPAPVRQYQEPVRAPPEPVREPVSESRIREPEYSTGRVGPHHREREGFFSRIFKKKPRQHAAAAPAPASHPAPKSRAPRKPLSDSAKKTIRTVGIAAVIIIVIAVVGYVAMNFIGGLSFGEGGSSGSDKGGSTPTATPTTGTTLSYNAGSTVTVAHTTKPITVPSQGVALYVSYLGGWKGSYTANGETISLERSGEYVRVLEDASGLVEATFQKKESSTRELVVKIFKNGAELASQSTTTAYGKVTVSTDVGAAVPTTE